MSESVAVLVTTSGSRPTMVRLLCTGNTGTLFRSLTTTVKLLVALNGGVPLSVTTVVITLVEGAWVCVGVHVMIPLPSIAAFVGEPTRAYTSASGGMSVWLAVLVTTNSVNSLIVRLVWTGSTGGLWTACTTTVNVLVALRVVALTACGS